MRRINVQANIMSHASWSCYKSLDLLMMLESRVPAQANRKSMGKIPSLLHSGASPGAGEASEVAPVNRITQDSCSRGQELSLEGL